MAYSLYKSGLIISSPEFNRVNVKRSIAPQSKVFTMNFKSRMKIFDAAYHQHTKLKSKEFNHCFLTPTFDLNDYDSWSNGNEAIKRFTDNLRQTYGASSYVWVREFTKQLVPHYHMLVTMPYANIKDLNRSWSIARGDVDVVPNALRTGWDKKAQRSRMKVSSWAAAISYCAKYIAKGQSGDVTQLSNKCNLATRHTWESKSGHTVKCYGMSNNVNFSAKKIDLPFFFQMHPEARKKFSFQEKENCDIFRTRDRHTLGVLNSFAEHYEKLNEKQQKKSTPKRKTSRKTQTSLKF